MSINHKGYKMKNRKNDQEKFNNLENFGMLDNMELDFTIFKLNRVWNSYDYIWSRFIRSA